ncbi:MAG: hypothetical protein EA425_04125 [Puniceicoccaceae bacterium]|nr:MAG: hypothetical protein EA425_04125 [Puniceicoccaceae bacterium]
MVSFRPLALLPALAALVLQPAADLRAQEEEAASGVSIRSISFGTERPQGTTDDWYVMTVELNVRGSGGGTPGPRFSDRVRVVVSLGFQNPRGLEEEFAFYRSEAEAVSIETGRAYFRFYLAPSIVRRDQLRGNPHSYRVQVFADGAPVVEDPREWSASLASPRARQSFEQRVSAEGGRNDGILQPQYLTPFWLAHPRATPYFLRR